MKQYKVILVVQWEIIRRVLEVFELIFDLSATSAELTRSYEPEVNEEFQCCSEYQLISLYIITSKIVDSLK